LGKIIKEKSKSKRIKMMMMMMMNESNSYINDNNDIYIIIVSKHYFTDKNKLNIINFMKPTHCAA